MNGRPAGAATGSAATADRLIQGRGTSEHRWAEWRGWSMPRRATLSELLAGTRRLVVVAPHPDDETLAVGGLVHDAAVAGNEVVIVSVTRGEASHPGSTTWPPDRLVRQRRSERAAALSRLQVAGSAAIEIGIRDGTVTENVGRLADLLVTMLASNDAVVSPWRYDGHPDHEAAAQAVRLACDARGIRSWEAPIWGWHWADPDEGHLPVEQLTVYEMSPAAQIAKRRAVAEFASQLRTDPSTAAPPILPEWALARWLRTQEVLLG